PVYSTALNVMGTVNVLEAARINAVGRVHLASSVWVYNGAPEGITADESVPFYLNGAGHLYTSTKIAADMLWHNHHNLYGVPLAALRLGIPYGPRLCAELLIPLFSRKALSGEPLTVAGKGTQYRRFVYVRDLAAAHVLAMSARAELQTYNLEGPRKISVLDVAQGIRDLIGEHVQIDFVPERAGDLAGREGCSGKVRDELGWVPTVAFEDGLRQTVEWFCAKWGRPLANGHDPALPLASVTNGNGTEPVGGARSRRARGGNGAKAVRA